jgi:Transmembrane secretion effector
MMVSQGGISIAGLAWSALATTPGPEWALFSASAMGIASALMAKRWSIDFSDRVNLEPDPLPREPSDPYIPESDDGPITSAIEIEVAPENHVRFFKLMRKIRLVFLRNGAFIARLDQAMENPNRFRLYAIFASWAAQQRLGQRITRDEHALWSELWTLHTVRDGTLVPQPRELPPACQPGQGTKVILLPATISRFQPEKSSNADGHHADVKCVVDRKNHEVIGKNQRNMDKCADAENQEMHYNADFRWGPSPKPDCTLVLFEVDRLTSIRSSRDFRGTGIRKLSENPGV